ncbi:MAG: M23 family metallopeptidase [Chloroflexi bacterium]|nr:M23 family metallopeptidase [Chloroflexota bacterium]
MPENQIMLLPKRDYWEWVKATQKYMLAFGVNVTPNPDNAGKYATSNFTVSIANPPNGYPNQGNILEYFTTNYPAAKLDVIEAATPQEFSAKLEIRVDARDRFGRQVDEKGQIDTAIRLHWPTDYPRVNQAFGANPEIYAQWNLPGHEGLDIRAPMNTNVYACADGDVYMVNDDIDNHPYGRHIRIQHANGYRTVYAHLASILATNGQDVKAKEKIALADSTGNSSGSHLHLTLKKEGSTLSGETNYPKDIMDPTPFMVPFGQEVEGASPVTYSWPVGKCLVGLNAREDGDFEEPDFEVVNISRLEAIKILSNTSSEDVSRLKQINSSIFIMARLHYKLGHSKVLPSEWATRMQLDLERLYQQGVRYFEIHRSPNLQSEGWSYSWISGEDFGRWWIDVVNILKDRFPQARYGFPGISPGGQVEGQRLDAKTFLEQADAAILAADWVGVNCFWVSEQQMNSDNYGMFYRYLRERYPDKLMFITEFGNVHGATNLQTKGRQYNQYYQHLRDISGLAAAFSNIIHSTRSFDSMVWRDKDGGLSPITIEVAQRNF